MLYITFFCTFLLICMFWTTVREERRKLVQSRISSVFHQDGAAVPSDENERQSLWERVGSPLWGEIRRNFQRKMKREQAAKLEIKLLRAGSPLGMGPVEYRLFKLTLLLIFPVIAFFYGELLGNRSSITILFVTFSVPVAAALPGFYLRMKTKSRNEKALKELPDILDLLTVSLEAGLGFDSALGKVVSRKSGVLPEEFHRCLEEIRLGKTRKDALSGVRERLTLNELRVLISNILQAEKLGIGLVKVLRIQSEEVREQRKQRAEEKAMKAPIKMLFPLVLFIFPSLFIVLLGPAVLQFMDAFANN
ncbi:MAG TPA: type II secretion system F family protein [Bacillales bacterium]|nr:type II secretion system F family protein [Bacillales bacterium]